jgi:N-methylhydantoinase B
VELRPGDVVSYRTCGGGGYGPPEGREPERVLRDVRDLKVSVARARETYRVAVDASTWTVDAAETARLRASSTGAERPSPGPNPAAPGPGRHDP